MLYLSSFQIKSDCLLFQVYPFSPLCLLSFSGETNLYVHRHAIIFDAALDPSAASLSCEVAAAALSNQFFVPTGYLFRSSFWERFPTSLLPLTLKSGQDSPITFCRACHPYISYF